MVRSTNGSVFSEESDRLPRQRDRLPTKLHVHRIQGNKVKKKKEKHNEEYIKYGFTVTTDRAGEEVPMCFVCSTLLSTEAIKPSKLLRHMESHHVFLNAKPIEYMQQMLRDFHMN